ncbi:peptidase inhibitor family I36 protein [Streptomyces coeruleorubidus]|uniref:peptidase inhibitor family I36 protein n=1 Tax=Streptomyces coeruleorubidus TaxID=116188 RepID=UPI003656322A
MIRRSLTAALVATASATVLVLTGGTAVHAGEEPTAEPSVTAEPSPIATPADEAPANPVIAEYNGREINLAESWEGAESCTELPSGEVHCYDSDAEALADPELPAEIREQTLKAAAAPAGARAAAAPPARCVADYWCLYMKVGYKGRLLRLYSDGKKDLAEWGCRDKLSAVYYWVGRYSLNYGDAKITDLRSWPVEDRVRRLDPPGGWSDFTNLDYPGGGHWNNKVDIFEVRRN